MNILRAIDDPKVFGPFFKAKTWQAWRAFLAALFALPMTPEQLTIYQRHTGRAAPPAQPLHEAWLVIGRRGGKSFILATIAVFLACFTDWRPYLGPVEIATIMIIARDRRQARVIKRFITGLLRETKMLRALIEAETADGIELRNRVNIEIHTASFRSPRGYTIVAALLDEIAYWQTDEAASDPDVEIISGAIRPGMATIPGAMLLCASSPHARRGALWDAYHRHYGQEGDEVLVWQAATRDMNPSVSQPYIDRHFADDPARAAAEYHAIFRTDVETFVPREVIEAAVVPKRFQLPPVPGISYLAAIDPAGGAGGDAMTLAIGHRSVEGRGVLDHLVERRPPFSPQNVINEFAEALKAYRVSKVVGDRWGGEFVREPLRGHGIEYELAEKAKSEWYRDALPIFTSSKAELLDHSRLVAQFCQLERRTARGGRDSIDHPPGGHDDLCNVVAMVLVLAAGGPQPIDWKTIGPKVIAESYANPYRRAHVFADRAEAIARNPFALGERGTAQARRARGY